MKTIFDPSNCEDLLRRVDTIRAGSERRWGKMTASQMLEHTARALEVATGRKPAKQAFLGRLISWKFRKGFVGETPFPQNAPTNPAFIVTYEPELASGREKVKALIRELHAGGEMACDGRVHSFFGRLTGVEWGVTQYKHVDHHLRQFGA